MSPDIYVRGMLIAAVPDKTGDYRAINGSLLRVEFDPENPRKIVVETAQLAGKQGRGGKNGRRELGLNRLGVGSQDVPGGRAWVVLHEPVFPKKNKGTRYPEVVRAARDRQVGWLKGHGRG